MRCVRPQFQWYQLAYATEMKSIQLHDSIEGLSQKIVSITLHYITSNRRRTVTRVWSKFDPDLSSLEVIWGRNISRHSKSQTYYFIFNIIYLKPFLRHLTSNNSGFDLDLAPLEVTWRETYLAFRKPVHTWLLIWLIWTSYLLLSRIIFEIFDFRVWPLTSDGNPPDDKSILAIRNPIHDFMPVFYWHHLSISIRLWNIILRTFNSLTLTLDL